MSLPADSSCEGRVSLHFTRSRFSMPATAGVVDEKGSEYILAHTGLRVSINNCMCLPSHATPTCAPCPSNSFSNFGDVSCRSCQCNTLCSSCVLPAVWLSGSWERFCGCVFGTEMISGVDQPLRCGLCPVGKYKAQSGNGVCASCD